MYMYDVLYKKVAAQVCRCWRASRTRALYGACATRRARRRKRAPRSNAVLASSRASWRGSHARTRTARPTSSRSLLIVLYLRLLARAHSRGYSLSRSRLPITARAARQRQRRMRVRDGGKRRTCVGCAVLRRSPVELLSSASDRWCFSS